MKKSLGVGLYLFLSKRGTGHWNRILKTRIDEGKEDPDRIEERRGIPSAPRPEGRLVWFHSASVGEVLSIQELVRRLGEEDPGLSFLLTTGTRTSAAILENRLPPRTIHQYIPLDSVGFVRRFLDHWHPEIAVWTESEIWPALMVETHARRIPMLLVNARISDRSFRRWRWMKGAAGSLFSRFHTVLAQDARTAAHLRRLGVPKNRLLITGTLKEGTAALPCDEAERDQIALQLKARPVWLMASSHAGEEEVAVAAHEVALGSSHRLLLIVAPRHPERGDEIVAMTRARGLVTAQRSKGDTIREDTQVLVADTLGEMGLWYRLAPISMVGGSLVEIGGHNPFEPAALGSAILHGPHVANFKDIYDRLSQAGAAWQVTDCRSLSEGVRALLEPDRAARMAHAAWEVCSDGAEVTDRALSIILDTLDAPR